jgi:hypothetical protein
VFLCSCRTNEDFWDTWSPKDSPVPGIIRHGLRLDFVSQPPTTSVSSPVHRTRPRLPPYERILKSLFDLLNSAADQVPHGRLYLRTLQLLNKVLQQGSPMSDRTLLAQPIMVSNSTRGVNRPPQEAPRVGPPPLAPCRESLPQLPFTSFMLGNYQVHPPSKIIF